MSSPLVKSAANGGPDAKARSPEEVSIEMMALRKELSQAKEEGMHLKGRMKRMEEEHAKKIKQLEKLLSSAKKESSEIEKKRESSAESASVLRAKCQKLEQALKEQEITMRKLQANSRPTRPTELKGLVVAYANNSPGGTSLDTKAIGRPSSGVPRNAGPSPASANELHRMRESVRKLQAENTKLQQQLKERIGEVKQLKQIASRTQQVRSNLSGSSSAPSALAQTNGRKSLPTVTQRATAVSAELRTTTQSGRVQQQTRLSQSTVHRMNTSRQLTTNSSSTVSALTKSVQKTVSTTNRLQQVSSTKKQVATNNNKSPKTVAENLSIKRPKTQACSPTTPSGKTPKHPSPASTKQLSSEVSQASSEQPEEPIGEKPHTTPKEEDTRVSELQQNSAAKKIQRSWRGHQQKIRQSQGDTNESSKNYVNGVANLEETDMEEEVELLQSVLRGHQERLQFVAMQQQDGEGDSASPTLKEALSSVQTAHQHIWSTHTMRQEE